MTPHYVDWYPSIEAKNEGNDTKIVKHIQKGEVRMTSNAPMNRYRSTAAVVGSIYLAGFVVGIGGDTLLQSILGAPNHLALVAANSLTVTIGALLWLIAVVGDAAHGVLLYPVLKPHNERIAVGYLAARIMDALFIAVMVLFVLLQIPLGSEYLNAATADAAELQALSNVLMQAKFYVYDMGMITLGISGILLCYTLYRTKLLPRWLAVWGLVGYAIIFCGMVSEIMESGLGLASSIPGGLWEVFVGVWLIVKGFNAPALVAETAKSEPKMRDEMSLSAT
ncbi:MAG TPA: DUF4386 domain-containing protein [Caldilineaceae bacterium]|nr:DUF4386 domain-containing protein [Caldilineaceae bacterium]